MTLTHEALDKAGDVATEIIANTAGAVADPKTAISKAKATSRRMFPIVAVMLAVVAIMMLRRRSGSSS